jgi:Cft2 family RNA processing exonuclease
MYDVHQAKAAVSDFKAFSLDDVDDAFASFKQLKYSQHLRLTGKLINCFFLATYC